MNFSWFLVQPVVLYAYFACDTCPTFKINVPVILHVTHRLSVNVNIHDDMMDIIMHPMYPLLMDST